MGIEDRIEALETERNVLRKRCDDLERRMTLLALGQDKPFQAVSPLSAMVQGVATSGPFAFGGGGARSPAERLVQEELGKQVLRDELLCAVAHGLGRLLHVAGDDASTHYASLLDRSAYRLVKPKED